MQKGEKHMVLKEGLRRLAIQRGTDLFGVASSDAFNDAPPTHRPRDVMSDAQSIVALGVKMLDAQTDLLRSEGDYFDTSPRQRMFQGHNTFISQEIDRVGYSIARLLEKKGFKAYHQMASTGGTDQRFLMGLLSLKHLSVQAGLGVIGRNSLLITPQFGPRVRLTAIVTNAEVAPDEPLEVDFCQHCEKPCIPVCPVKAIEEPSRGEPYRINKYACQQYLSTRPACSLCLKACPVGSSRVE
ncbi:MAG: epoxyqueuosine reductase [Candidatus Bathyarchaeota archaeon]|nr:MAG: epoxyqueuosine reductase [Candidatus Bathyarchaeota archaeon]